SSEAASILIRKAINHHSHPNGFDSVKLMKLSFLSMESDFLRHVQLQNRSVLTRLLLFLHLGRIVDSQSFQHSQPLPSGTQRCHTAMILADVRKRDTEIPISMSDTDGQRSGMVASGSEVQLELEDETELLELCLECCTGRSPAEPGCTALWPTSRSTLCRLAFGSTNLCQVQHSVPYRCGDETPRVEVGMGGGGSGSCNVEGDSAGSRQPYSSVKAGWPPETGPEESSLPMSTYTSDRTKWISSLECRRGRTRSRRRRWTRQDVEPNTTPLLSQRSSRLANVSGAYGGLYGTPRDVRRSHTLGPGTEITGSSLCAQISTVTFDAARCGIQAGTRPPST
ncbi:hypothetical protein HII31_09819, partial [Pseudocercospora fuligena]